MLEQFYDFSARLLELDQKAMGLCRPEFEKIDAIRDYNQVKMLKAFTENRVAATHLAGTTGYGYDDAGRDKLDRVFAQAVGAEDALCRPHFLSGTHALTVALFGLLRAGDTLLAATGRPYDTLEGVIGIDGAGKGCGSLAEFGVKYDEAPLREGGVPDYELIAQKAREARVCHIQRSRGYSSRAAFDLETIGRVARTAKQANPEILVMVDNCYGEFVEANEPSDFGADMIVGSLIKNPGGGLAPIGGYICGTQKCVDRCAYRLSAPGLGQEVGANLGLMPALYQGFFLAPSVVSGAVKGAVFVAACYEKLGFTVVPSSKEARHDIIQCVELGSPEGMVAFCKGIQSAAAVDSYVDPVPAPMPGYDSDVIMAAGAFVQGSSIELSADGPVREPYAVYYQGGLTWYHAKLGVLLSLQKMLDAGLITLP